ncbi:hypothetical protein OS242_15155 [Tumebacillus sp. DT12]|uniref:Uncharacterized protein n=1 Tax=Tumebacillus lacus TaxID=2995335 RepID=A0ABT3X308_9BACL|nr:hypothetical protein [Tumebacillus lacus]MCX7571289.1 hypothetical protein [Tumebacillus lacus]
MLWNGCVSYSRYDEGGTEAVTTSEMGSLVAEEVLKIAAKSQDKQ